MRDWTGAPFEVVSTLSLPGLQAYHGCLGAGFWAGRAGPSVSFTLSLLWLTVVHRGSAQSRKTNASQKASAGCLGPARGGFWVHFGTVPVQKKSLISRTWCLIKTDKYGQHSPWCSVRLTQWHVCQGPNTEQAECESCPGHHAQQRSAPLFRVSQSWATEGAVIPQTLSW